MSANITFNPNINAPAKKDITANSDKKGGGNTGYAVFETGNKQSSTGNLYAQPGRDLVDFSGDDKFVYLVNNYHNMVTLGQAWKDFTDGIKSDLNNFVAAFSSSG